MLRHKFNAHPTTIDNIKFASKLEAKYYEKLKLARSTGALLFFLRQVPFSLPGNTTYRADFMEFWADGEIRVVDCKGILTEVFKLKKRQVEEFYPITIQIVKKV